MTPKCEATLSSGTPCEAAHGQFIHRADDDPEAFVPCAVDGATEWCPGDDIRGASVLHDWRLNTIRVVIVGGLCQLHRRRARLRLRQRAGVGT